jgi:phenylalanyl-tRNA synthetase beta chain
MLRHHPLAGVLGALATNLRRQHPGVRLFEIGKTYARAEDGAAESRWATIALGGARSDPAWYRPAEPADVYDVKGLAEHTLETLGVTASVGKGGTLSGFEDDCHGALVGPDGVVLAEFGEVAAAVRSAFDIDGPVFAAVLSLDAVAAQTPAVPRYQPLPRFPAVQRDVAFVVEASGEVTAAGIETVMRELAGTLLRDLTLFDVFRFPDGRRSLAWRLTFQAEDRTLTDDEVNTIQERVARGVSERFHITWRGV